MSTTQKTVNLLLQGREIDPKALERFVNATIARRDLDSEDMQAAVFIVACRMGLQGGDNMKAELRRMFGFGTTKRNKGGYGFRPSEAAIDSPAFDIVMRHVCDAKKLTLEAAVEEFQSHVAVADAKTIKRWIEAIRPRAEMHLADTAKLKTWADRYR